MITHINDTHCGVLRSGGTTPASAWGLRNYVQDCFRQLLSNIRTHLIINGDLFDTFNVPLHDLLETYYALDSWLAHNPDCMLILSAGNHDLAKNTTLKSSFQVLCDLLQAHSPQQVFPVFEPASFTLDGMDIHVIPHRPNQDVFSLDLTRVPDGVKYLFLHCNYDNKFAMQADNSLNLSPEQAQAAPVERIIIAHEHQRRVLGKVILPGNQIPTSVADCLGPNQKFMLRLGDEVEYVPVWSAEDSFQRVGWQELGNLPSWAQFIRVEGKALASEASAVVSAISKLRSTHSAFVISNAVEIENLDDNKLAVSLEQVRSFDVLEALLKHLTKSEGSVVKKLLEEDDANA